jgi:hypothetical protein
MCQVVQKISTYLCSKASCKKICMQYRVPTLKTIKKITVTKRCRPVILFRIKNLYVQQRSKMRSKHSFSQPDSQTTIFITRKTKTCILKPTAEHHITNQWIWLTSFCPVLNTVNKFFSFIQRADHKVAVSWNSWLTCINCWD